MERFGLSNEKASRPHPRVGAGRYSGLRSLWRHRQPRRSRRFRPLASHSLDQWCGQCLRQSSFYANRRGLSRYWHCELNRNLTSLRCDSNLQLWNTQRRGDFRQSISQFPNNSRHPHHPECRLRRIQRHRRAPNRLHLQHQWWNRPPRPVLSNLGRYGNCRGHGLPLRPQSDRDDLHRQGGLLPKHHRRQIPDRSTLRARRSSPTRHDADIRQLPLRGFNAEPRRHSRHKRLCLLRLGRSLHPSSRRSLLHHWRDKAVIRWLLAFLLFSTSAFADPGSNTFAAGQNNPPATNALVGYWSFDEGKGSTVYDYSPYLRNGTWTGTLGGQWVVGKIQYGGNFNGTDNYVSGALPSAATTNITLTSWV